MKIIAAWVIALAIVGATATAAAPSAKQLQRDVKLTSQAHQIDRSGKTDRITAAVHTSQPALLPGCEPPFSRLTRLQSPVHARCLT